MGPPPPDTSQTASSHQQHPLVTNLTNRLSAFPAELRNMTPELGIDLVVRRIRGILEDSVTLRRALYFRLLRITQYLAWKFPSYGALQILLEDLIRVGQENTGGNMNVTDSSGSSNRSLLYSLLSAQSPLQALSVLTTGVTGSIGIGGSTTLVGQQLTAVYQLGRRYESVRDPNFVREWNKKFLFTYRKNFKPIRVDFGRHSISTGSDLAAEIEKLPKPTSDKGWGCYLRVFQMVLAHCYQTIIGPDLPLEREIIKAFFIDSETARFSVHNFCRIGFNCFKRPPGKWFGPYSAAKTVEVLFEEIEEDFERVCSKSDSSSSSAFHSGDSLSDNSPGASMSNQNRNLVNRNYKASQSNTLSERELRYATVIRPVVFDGLLDPDEVKKKFNYKNAAVSVLVFLCMKLGPDKTISPEHSEAVLQSFRLPSFAGLCSGDLATSAHYFIACSENQRSLFYLDPHVETREALDGAELTSDTWHAIQTPPRETLSNCEEGNIDRAINTPLLLQLPLQSLNSSCCFCFLLRDEGELAQLCLELEMYDALAETFEVARGGEFLRGLEELGMPNLEFQSLGGSSEEEEGFALL